MNVLEKILNDLISIDDNCQKILKEIQEKQDNIEYFVNEELSKKKDEIKNKYKFKIDMKKNEYETKFADTERKIEQKKSEEIEKIRKKYAEEKEKQISKVINDIILK